MCNATKLQNFSIQKATISNKQFFIEYATNFKIEYSASKKLWQITILHPLDPKLLDSNSYITATLIAKIDGSTYSPEAAFVLSLPEKEVEEAPVFTQSYYKAKYAITGTTSVVTFDDDIGFTNKKDMSKIKIVSDGRIFIMIDKSCSHLITKSFRICKLLHLQI